MKILSDNSEKCYESAWQVLFNKSFKKVYKTSFAILLDAELAKDAAQEAFIQAYLKFDTLKDIDKFDAWICSIAVNTSKNILKKKIKHTGKFVSMYDQKGKIKNNIIELIDFNIPEDIYENTELIRELLKCIENLNSEEKRIINLKYYNEFTFKQIAEYLELNTSTVKMKFQRAKEKLLTKLKKYSRHEGVGK